MGAIPGMFALATWMMKDKMEKAQIPALPDVQEMARIEGVQFIACKMTVDMMKFTEDDFLDGVIIHAAEDFLKYAKDSKSVCSRNHEHTEYVCRLKVVCRNNSVAELRTIHCCSGESSNNLSRSNPIDH